MHALSSILFKNTILAKDSMDLCSWKKKKKKKNNNNNNNLINFFKEERLKGKDVYLAYDNISFEF